VRDRETGLFCKAQTLDARAGALYAVAQRQFDAEAQRQFDAEAQRQFDAEAQRQFDAEAPRAQASARHGRVRGVRVRCPVGGAMGDTAATTAAAASGAGV